VLDAGALQMSVPVLGLHEPRAALIGDAPDCADEGEMLGLGRDPQELARLEIDRNFDGKPRVPVEALVRCHKGETY
jgi:hypothetical protein